MKKQFTDPEIDIVTFVAEDIIATSDDISDGIGGKWETPLIP